MSNRKRRHKTNAKNKPNGKSQAQPSKKLGKRQNIRRVMTILKEMFAWLAGIAAIMVSIFALFAHRRDWAIIAGWLGVLFLVSAFFAWFLDVEWKREEAAALRVVEKTNVPTIPMIEDQINENAKNARARNWKPPPLPPDFTAKGRMVSLNLGGTKSRWPANKGRDAPDAPAPIIYPGGRIVTPYEENNRIYVKAQTMFGEAEQTVAMNNEWPSKIPKGGDRNFNDSSFEIVDANQLPVFQIKYISADSIEVNGVFVGANGGVTVAFSDGTKGVLKQPAPKLPIRKAWFKYPSEKFPGVLAQ